MAMSESDVILQTHPSLSNPCKRFDQKFRYTAQSQRSRPMPPKLPTPFANLTE